MLLHFGIILYSARHTVPTLALTHQCTYSLTGARLFYRNKVIEGVPGAHPTGGSAPTFAT